MSTSVITKAGEMAIDEIAVYSDLPEAGKFLNFQLGQERYSLAVAEVREIIRLCPITPVPRMPEHFLGVINLRGKIVPVIDLRQRLHLPGSEAKERACIIVVHHHAAASPDQLVGLQVDLVDEVVFIEQSAIEPVPDFCDTVDGKFIQAMAKYKDSVLAILSVAELLKDAGNLQTNTALAPEQDQ